MPPWRFRPARDKTPERGREEAKDKNGKAKSIDIFTIYDMLRSGGRRQLPFELHAGSIVVDSINVLVFQMTKCLKLHRIIERCGCYRTVFSSRNAECGVWTYLVHFCE